MKMESLKILHQSMRRFGFDMQQFQVNLGAASFDCLFSTREQPFVLALTSRGLNPRFLRFEVTSGYWINEYFGDLYSSLVNLLRTDGRSGQPLIPREFLKQLDEVIPHYAKPDQVPEPHEIIRLRADLGNIKRPYFDTWIYWKRASAGSPSKENRLKTLVALGFDALEHSKSMNASTRWCATPTGRTWQNEGQK